MDKLRIFIKIIKEISLIKRIFGWSKIKFASYEAYEEFKKLENQIGKLEVVKKELESINKLNNLNEINLMELKTEIKFLREKNEELIKENQNYKSKDQQKEIEYSKKMVEFNQAQKNLTEAREKVFNDAVEKENLKLEKMKNQWQEHERITGEIIENLCSTLRIQYLKNPPIDKKPDNTIQIMGEYIVFDAKSPLNENLDNFPKYLKAQAKSMEKYTSQKLVKNEIFLVVPSNTMEYIPEFRFSFSGYFVNIIAKDSIEMILISLKKIEDIDLAGKLDPRDRDNLINVISSFAYFIGRNGRINLELGEQSVKLIEEMRSLVPKDFIEDVVKSIAGQSFNIAYDKPGKVENTENLKKLIKEQKDKADYIEIEELNSKVRKELSNKKMD